MNISEMSDDQLLQYHQKIVFEAAKYSTLEKAKKVELNSAFGALGTPYFRFYDIRQAEAITLSGQMASHWIMNKINLYLNDLLKTDKVDYILASDTDSLYLTLNPLVERMFKDKPKDKTKIINFLDSFCNEYLQKEITNGYQELSEYLNTYQQKMKMKREAIADRVIWVAAKNYILNVYDVEGIRYTSPKIKMVGITAIKSTTPASCKQKLKEAIYLIINGTEQELQNYVLKVENELKALPPEKIAIPKGCNNLNKYSDRRTVFRERTPMHVGGALIYNKLLEDMKLTKKFPIIHEGEKIKYLHLIEPNPTGNHVISFPDKFPIELGLHKYIDYDIQFDRTFLAPLDSILNAINWSAKKKQNLKSFFS